MGEDKFLCVQKQTTRGALKNIALNFQENTCDRVYVIASKLRRARTVYI